MNSAAGNYPLATIAPYGPNARQATKLVVGIFPREQKEPSAIRKWFVESGDIRENQEINAEIVAFLKEHNVAQATFADRILGCPHEEGVDYPEAQSCPVCTYWIGRNRLGSAGPKPGRNDPCPCGSGKKFKKCCGAV